MNANIEVLDEATHRDVKVNFAKARSITCKERLLPVVISEFHSLMFHYPIVFVKDKNTGAFTCSVLLGVNSDANLLDAQDLLNDTVLPLNVRRQPFLAIAPSTDSEDKAPLVGINLHSPGIAKESDNEEHAEPLFPNTSQNFDSAISALSQYYNGLDATNVYIQKALELGLISKLKAEIIQRDKTTLTLDGLYSVDTNKINKIVEADSHIKDEFLQIATYAYAQSFSLYNMNKLVDLLN